MRSEKIGLHKTRGGQVGGRGARSAAEVGAPKSMTKVTYLTLEDRKDLEVILHAVPAWHKARGRRMG